MTADSQTSELWSTLVGLQPGLRSHIKVFPQYFRGEKWYVISDETNGQYLRINEAAYGIVGRFEGALSLGSIYEFVQEQRDVAVDAAEDVEEPLQKDQVIDLLTRLHAFGALDGIGDKPTQQLVDEYEKRQSSTRWRKVLSPLMVRIPLIDPNQLLDRLIPRCLWLFTRTTLFMWLLFVLLATAVVLTFQAEIRAEISTEVLKPANLLLLWILYPFLKLVHEFAHALCVKYWGGDMHEMGITLLVLTPVPYVNASAATAFKSKWQRMAVSAAGIAAEMFLASIAIVLWVLSEPGLFHDTMLGIFLIGVVSTLLFNANPLLRFDGYFILQDWLEIPNLFSRSSEWYRYKFKQKVLKIDSAVSPQTAPGESFWFAFYGFSSQVYRLFVIFAIAFFLASKFMILGVLLAVWAVIQQLLLPAFKFVKYLLVSPDLERKRRPVFAFGGLAVLTMLALALFVPIPQSTLAQGIVWLPEQGQIYAPADGFVAKVHVTQGEHVQVGQPLLTLENPDLQQKLAIEQSRLAIMRVEEGLAATQNASELVRKREDRERQAEIVTKIENDVRQLQVKAEVSGVFMLADLSAGEGRYFAEGILVGHLIDPASYIVQVVVPERLSGPLHKGIKSAHVRLAENPLKTHLAEIDHLTPAANNSLPSAALGAAGGGGIAVASSDTEGLTTLERVFHLQLNLEGGLDVAGVGERAYVKLKHRAEPVAMRWYRSLQQTFISRIPGWMG